MEAGEGDTWGNVDRHVGRRLIAHTYSGGDRHAFRHLQLPKGV